MKRERTAFRAIGGASRLSGRAAPEAALPEKARLIGNPIVIGGIPLPSDAPLFLALVALHVAAGVICVIAGAVAMLSRKQRGRHPRAGTIYYSALAVIFVTMAALSDVPMGGGRSPVRARRLVVRRRDDRSNGETQALAGLGAHSHDRNGLVLRSSDHRLLRRQRAEPAVSGGNCLISRIGFCRPWSGADFAERARPHPLAQLTGLEPSRRR